ncbi:MAG: hypothetical protein Q8M65_01570 [Rhodoglobus sp.]|nr:hypothetical protein [Rhodoglobus sp.]
MTTLSALLDTLQAEGARLGDAAVTATAEADRAQVLLDQAAERAGQAASASDDAAKRANASASRAAHVAAALYRSGGSDLTTALLVDGGNDLLARMGTLDQLSSSVLQVLQKAEIDLNEADSRAAQADLARSERNRLAIAAQQTAQAAQAAADAADAAVAEQQVRLAQVYEQLALLRNSTAELERQYRIGQSADNGSGSGSGDGGGGGIQVPDGGSVNNPAAARAFAYAQLAARGFGADQNDCLLWLWNRESGWRTNAYNASSGAYGIPQALPGSKMGNYAADWRTNYETQVMWGLIYIQGRYGSPCAAWAHSQSVGWY